MKRHSKIKMIALSATLALSIMSTPILAKDTAIKASRENNHKTVEYKTVLPMAMVNDPANYLNKYVRVVAKFDKFSTLGLDYKPAFKDSQKYISFLIQRDDITDHTIPLSEMKIIIDREKAEKFVDIESGDKIEFTGKVYSTALNDPWIEVDDFKVLSSKSEDKKASTK